MNPPDTAQLDRLVAWMQEGGFRRVSWSNGATTIALALPDAGPLRAAAWPVQTIVSPGMGRFTLRHPVATGPYATPGASVAAGDIVALLAVGPVLTAIEAPCAGVIRRVLVDEGAVVGFEDPLFEIEPTEG